MVGQPHVQMEWKNPDKEGNRHDNRIRCIPDRLGSSCPRAPSLTLGVRSTCRRVTVVCLVNCVICIVISRTASPGAKVTTKMNSMGYLHQDRLAVFDIMP